MAEMNELIDEIKEDVRIDQLIKFWKKYANFIIAGLLLILLVTAASVAWEHFKSQKNLKHATLYEEALQAIEAKQPENAAKILDDLKNDHDGYQIISTFKKAHLPNTSQEERFTLYLSLAENKNIESKFRDLAVILWGYEGFESLNPDTLTKYLDPIANGTSVWRESAVELLGLLAIRQNNLKKAAAFFKLLLEDRDTSPSIKSRAMAYLEQIGALN